ncbi:hypothetical protein [Fusobacterium periodonticum]|uniref:Uncharacterized protein n=1 Tax=Fusobacterium periodonticum D10 TaxID=620833 RepID=K1GLG9_9FUSO|nr:hypothetical protein [Fusobacterium periodonticum]EKA94145.1 hypothetical protein FPOG_00727 [Fusobacterium periodonticum D10]
MNEKYYPKELEVVKEHISQFTYFDKYTSEKDLKELLEKNELLNIEKLEKILINSTKISDNTDFIKKLKIDGTVVLEKKHLYLFYYFLISFFEKDIAEQKLKNLENFLRQILKIKRLSYEVELNQFEKNFYNFLRDDNLKNKGIEVFLYDKLNSYFKEDENEIFRFCKEYYLLVDSFSLKKLLFRYLKENQQRISIKSFEAIKSILKI